MTETSAPPPNQDSALQRNDSGTHRVETLRELLVTHEARSPREATAERLQQQ